MSEVVFLSQDASSVGKPDFYSPSIVSISALFRNAVTVQGRGPFRHSPADVNSVNSVLRAHSFPASNQEGDKTSLATPSTGSRQGSDSQTE